MSRYNGTWSFNGLWPQLTWLVPHVFTIYNIQLFKKCSIYKPLILLNVPYDTTWNRPLSFSRPQSSGGSRKLWRGGAPRGGGCALDRIMQILAVSVCRPTERSTGKSPPSLIIMALNWGGGGARRERPPPPKSAPAHYLQIHYPPLGGFTDRPMEGFYKTDNFFRSALGPIGLGPRPIVAWREGVASPAGTPGKSPGWLPAGRPLIIISVGP